MKETIKCSIDETLECIDTNARDQCNICKYFNKSIKTKIKNSMNIKEGEVYFLDLGALEPIEVKVLKVYENEILVEYLNSTPGRRELLPKEVF